MCLPARLVVKRSSRIGLVSTSLRSAEASIAVGICSAQASAVRRGSEHPSDSERLRSRTARSRRAPAVRCTSLRAEMARRSLRPELNRIRAWVRQGRTDAWIAHQLEVTVQQIQAFKREQGLEPDGEPERRHRSRLRRRDRPAGRGRRADRRRARGGRGAARRAGGGRGRRSDEDEDEDEEGGARRTARRRRGRRGGRRSDPAQVHPARGHLRPRRGGLRPVARRRRPGRSDLRRVLGRHRPVEVSIEEDQIVIRRVGDDDDDRTDDGD